MKNLILAAFLLAALPLTSFAAVDTAVVEGIVWGGGEANATAYTQFIDGGDTVQYYGPTFSINGITTTQGLVDAAQNAVNSYASGQGWSLSSIVWPFLSPSETQVMINSSLENVLPDSFVRVEMATGTVSGGSGGVSIDISSLGFTEIEHVVWEAVDDTKVYTFGSLSASTSSVSATVKVQSFTSGNALLNLLGGLVSVLTGASQTNAPNSTAVRAIVIGR